MSIIEVLPKVHMIKNHGNSFVIEFEDHCVIVDTGMDKKAKEILEAVEKTGKKPKAVLITHGHLDHINGLAKLKEKYPNLIVASSEEDRSSVEGRQMLLPKGIKGIVFKIFMPFMGFKGTKVDKILTDGETFENMKVIETSGHTKGHLSFLFKAGSKNVLFSGDLVLNEKNKLSLAPNEFNFDKSKIVESLKRISRMKIDCLLPGHGEPVIEKANEKIKNFISSLK
jgi:glyoxylase-like metal-dependent hydrolase (beta-lactamase superfamily II)